MVASRASLPVASSRDPSPTIRSQRTRMVSAMDDRRARHTDAHASAGGAAAAPRRGLGAPQGMDKGRGLGEPFGHTERTDAWWLQPLVQGLALLVLGAYATWAAFQGRNYEWGHYLSPFYSPLMKPK